MTRRYQWRKSAFLLFALCGCQLSARSLAAAQTSLPSGHAPPALAAASDGSAVPPAIRRAMNSGHFEPADFQFLRGRFPGASPEQVREWASIDRYETACMAAAAQSVRSELRRAGVTPLGIQPQPFG